VKNLGKKKKVGLQLRKHDIVEFGSFPSLFFAHLFSLAPGLNSKSFQCKRVAHEINAVCGETILHT